MDLWIQVPYLKFVALPVPEIIGVLKKWADPGYGHAPFSPQFLRGFCLDGWTLWIYLPNLKFVALSVPEIIGGTQKIWAVLDTPTLPFLQNFLWASVRMDRVNVSAKFAVVRSFSCSWDNNDCSFGVGLRTHNLGEGEVRRPYGVGDRMIPFERAFVTPYRLSIVTFPVSLRVSQILPLLCSSTPLFPTPPLVSPKCSHVPLGIGGWPLGYEEQRCWANCPCN